MRAQFEQWLLNYKEYKKAKAQNTVKTVDTLSDEAVLKGTIQNGLFCCDNFIQFAKSRQNIIRVRPMLPNEKKALELLGDFYQIMEYTSVPYADSHSLLYEYCTSLKMSYSYKPVIIMMLIQVEAWKKPCPFAQLCSLFCDYYKDRINNALIAEKDNSIFSNLPIDFEKAETVILNNPIAILEKDGVILFNVENNCILFSSQYSPSPSEKEDIKLLCEDKLRRYYELLASSKQKKVIPNAEVKDALDRLEEAILSSGDRPRIRDSKYHLHQLSMIWGETAGFGHVIKQDSPPKATPVAIPTLSDDDERSVGKLVKEQMAILSELGFTFDQDLFHEMCTLEWSKKTFNLYYPFFRIVKPGVPVSLQKKDSRGNNRYWKQVFPFGNGDVLITSEWYKESKPLFIRWFQNIEAAQQKETELETPLPTEKQNPIIDQRNVVIDGCKVVVHIQGSRQQKTFIIDTEKYPAQKAFLGRGVGSSVVLRAYGNEGIFIIDEII